MKKNHGVFLRKEHKETMLNKLYNSSNTLAFLFLKYILVLVKLISTEHMESHVFVRWSTVNRL